MVARPASGQEEFPCNIAFKAWVDPYYGNDGPIPAWNGPWCSNLPAGEIAGLQQLNDPTQPFKTIQRAIDAVHYALIISYCAAPNGSQGLVLALPGVYKESTIPGQGETFPIRMRDRVHVKGLHARGCVIRAEHWVTSTVSVPWPVVNSGSLGCYAPREQKVVLVDYSSSGEFKNATGVGVQDLPWSSQGDTAELLDGFTFEGGDVQVLFGPLNPYRWPLSGRITNCLFDMRHDPTTEPQSSTVRGPWIAILMAKEMENLTGACPVTQTGVAGYFDHRVLIANNTFVMAQCEPGPTWVNYCRPEAVAIIDTTSQQGLWIDTDISNRGVGNPVIANNLFRTGPAIAGPPMPFAMLGIDLSDTLTVTAPPSITAPTNVFASTRVGSTNGYFFSTPVATAARGAFTGGPWHQMWDCKTPACVLTQQGCTPACAAAQPPQPVVELYDGTLAPGIVDAGFVGEWIASQLNIPYCDWRIMPGSPLEDLGMVPYGAVNGTVIPEPACQEIKSFAFDHEGWGNPRVVNGLPDVGFDERHGLIVAATYGNETISHNTPPIGIQPTANQGWARRFFIMPASTSNFVTINGTVVAPASPSPTAWSYPQPGALQPPIVDGNVASVDYRTQWVSFQNRCPAPTPWPRGGALVPPPVQWTSPAGGQLAFGSCRRIDGLDNLGMLDIEGTTSGLPDAPRYFCLQAIQHTVQNSPLTSKVWYSNLQFEYR